MTLTISTPARRITFTLNAAVDRPFAETIYFDLDGIVTGRHQSGMRYIDPQDVPAHFYVLCTTPGARVRAGYVGVQELITATTLCRSAGLTASEDLDALLEEWRFAREDGREPNYEEDPAALRARVLGAAAVQWQLDEARDRAELAAFEQDEAAAAPTI